MGSAGRHISHTQTPWQDPAQGPAFQDAAGGTTQPAQGQTGAWSSGNVDAGASSQRFVTAGPPSLSSALSSSCSIFAHPQHYLWAKSQLLTWGCVAPWSTVGPFPLLCYHSMSHYSDPGRGEELFSYQHLHHSPKPPSSSSQSLWLLDSSYP